MITTDNKSSFIENLIMTSYNQENSLELEKQLYDLLLQDTSNGKLYKYRVSDKDGYSLKNLKNNTLHCSNPSAFNDPFDCKIGITFTSLYEAMWGVELDSMVAVCEKFIQVRAGLMNLSECSETEQRIILKLLRDERLMNFISENQEKNITDEEIAQKICENPYILTDILQTFLSDQAFAPSLGICASMLPKMIENISPEGMLKISDNNVTFEDFAQANGVCDDADEIGLTLRLSEKIQPELTSARENVQKLFDNADKQISQKMKELLIGCLCTDYKNKLMWSHYADSHKGFCIEYDYSTMKIDSHSIFPFPVIYSDKRPLIPWKAALDNSPENREEAFIQITKGLLTKDSIWSYENEWRILAKATEAPDIPMPRISCVYLGASISNEDKATILEIAKEKNYTVKQMVVDRGTYDLHAEDIVL